MRPGLADWRSYRLVGIVSAGIILGLSSGHVLELGFLIRHHVWSSFLLSPLLLGLAVTRRSPRPRAGWYGVWCLTFILALLGTWHHPVTDLATIGGLIPLNDYGEYYTSARRLTEGYRFLDVASSRPLSTGFLSFVLWLSGGDLQVTLLVFALLCSLASCLFVDECRKAVGGVAAVCSGTLVFVFYSRFMGTGGTEELGLTLALIGTALLLRAASSGHFPSAWFGLLLLTLALMARAGALFVLPALTLWVARTFRTDGRVSGIKVSAAALAIVLAFCLNAALAGIVGSGSQPPFGNFSFSLFGLVSGGKGWSYVNAVHPELRELPLNAQCREIYALAWQAFSERPERPIVGAARYLVEFVKPTGFGVFGFVVSHRFANVAIGLERLFNVAMRTLLLGLSLAAIHYCWKNRQRPPASLVLAGVVGIVASVPFVPPIDTDQSRAYAATIPFVALAAALAAQAAFSRLRSRRFALECTLESRGWTRGALFGTSLAVLAVCGPVLVTRVAVTPIVTPAVCAQGQSARYLRLSHATGIRLAAGASGPSSRSGAALSGHRESGPDHPWLRRIGATPVIYDPGSTADSHFLDVLDVAAGSRLFLIVPEALAGGRWQRQGISAVCGVPGHALGHPVLEARSVVDGSAAGGR